MRPHDGAEICIAEVYLGDHGHPGERFAGGMCNNEYMWRPWHLPEHLHVTNWATRQMCRQIVRRDPSRPAFWYLSFSHPHPPLAPLQAYLDIYRDIDPPDAIVGDWARGEPNDLPVAIGREIQQMLNAERCFSDEEIGRIRRAYYAQCTHIDHQIRIVLGTLRQQKLLGNTIVCFTTDHGDMLGNHRMWAKHGMYEDSARVPMILMGTDEQKQSDRVGHDRVDDRLVGLADVMPTLLELAGLDVPPHCQGLSMVADKQREHFFGAFFDCIDDATGNPTRMIRDARYKLIYYPAGNHRQLFDMHNDRDERHDLAADPAHGDTLSRLTAALVDALPADERNAWVADGQLTGWPDAPGPRAQPNSSLSGQRGLHWPTP